MLGPTIRKEVLLLKRDPRVLVRLILLPVAFIALFGMVFKAAKDKANERHALAVFVDPGAAGGRSVVAALDKSGMFKLDEKPSGDEVRARVADKSYDVGVIVDKDFDPMHGKPAHLVIVPGEEPQVTQPLIGSITGIMTRAYVGGAPPPVVVLPENPKRGDDLEPTSFQLTVPSNAVLFGFFIALTCALGFAEERRSGTWRRLLAAPVPAWKLLVAKLIPYVALGMIQVSTLFVIGAYGFGMQVAGSVPALAVLTLGVSCCATALGLMIASISSTEKQISSLGAVLILIMGLVGGCMFPRALMPASMQQVGLFVPHGWALDGYYTLLVHKGTGFVDVAKQIGAVFGFAGVFAFIGLRRFKFDS